MVVPAQHLIPFADFELDLRSGELSKEGVKIRLQEQPFRLLAALLESPGQVLTREELRRRLWPADTFVDFDHRLAAAISKLREALQDSAEHPKFVETVGRRGYRFIFPIRTAQAVEDSADTQQRTAAEPVPFLPAAWKTFGRRGIIAAVLLVVLAAGWFLRHRWQQSAAASVPQISSIAVLPLENLSNDPEQEYFTEGMTDEIITDLAKLPGLRVISRTSTAQYKDTHKALPQIARELKVDGVVEGTVLRSGNRIRIRAQLVYAPTDQHLWANAYERDVKDVLTLQATLARDIASEIQLKLTSQQQAHLAAARPVDPEAHELYLKGRYFWNKRDEEGLSKAVEYFQQAIAKDPNYAAAYAGLADAYSLGGGHLTSDADVMAKAKAAADKALELDHDLAEAEASLGLIAPFLDWNWAAAQQHFERAIALNPNYATAHHWYAEAYLIPMGEVDEAIAEARKAQELDPLSPVIATDLGKELYFARRYDEAVLEFRRALELDPDFVSAHNWLSDTFLEKGMYPEAIAELEGTKPYKEERVYIRQTAYLYARMGRRTEAEQALKKSLQLSKGKHVSSGAVALVYAMLGQKDKSFFWLEKACAEKSSFMTSLKVWPAFDDMRADPRFTGLLRNVGLPE